MQDVALHSSMATATASVKLTNDMVPATSSSGVANIMQFKNRQVPFPQAVSIIND
jgi:hypothetical protein